MTSVLTSPTRRMGSYHGRFSFWFQSAICASVAPAESRTSARLTQSANDPSGISDASQSTVSFFSPSNASAPMVVNLSLCGTAKYSSV